MAHVIKLDSDPYITNKNSYLSLTDFLSLKNLNELKNLLVYSNVSINDKSVLDKTKRKSVELKNKVFITDECEEFNEKLYSLDVHIDPKGWKFLKYTKGDFFTKHVDSVGEFTALLFPKFSLNNDLKGGELVIEKKVYNPCNFTHHTLIIFPSNTEHEVKPIINGTRYVFKTALLSNTKTVRDNYSSIINELNNSNVNKPAIADNSFSEWCKSNNAHSIEKVEDDFCDFGNANMFGEDIGDY